MSRPTREDAEQAVRTLLAYAGDDPDREGLLDTPKRVVKAYDEWFGGYEQEPADVLARTFKEVEGYDNIVVLRNMTLRSTCEHHMAPILGRVHVAYLPSDRVVGISKLSRIVRVFARRLQVQEKMTAQVADAIAEHLRPRGVAVVVEAEHLCMTTRGVNEHGTIMVTSAMRGVFRDNAEARAEVLALMKE